MRVRANNASGGGGVHYRSDYFTVASGTDKTIPLTFEPTIVSLVIDNGTYYCFSIQDTVHNVSYQFGYMGSTFHHNASTIVINGNSITLPYISSNFNGKTCYWYATDYTGA